LKDITVKTGFCRAEYVILAVPQIQRWTVEAILQDDGRYLICPAIPNPVVKFAEN